MADLLSLRPLGRAGQVMVRQWLRDPGVQRWWGSAAAADAAVSLAFDSEAAICRLIELDGTPIGYAQAIDILSLDATRPRGLASGTYDCDVFIGADAHRGQGHGPRALMLISDEVFATTLAVACAVIISIRNEAAARAYEKAGFAWREIWDDPVDGPSWVMVRERPRPTM